MSRRLLTLLFVLLCLAACGPREPKRLPNVLVILADDQGWGDLGINGNTNLATPHIDSLARDGASFDRFFVSPAGPATRAEFLTGRYHPWGGVYGTGAGAERLDLDEYTIAETFRAGGYATGAFGKWHNGSQHPYHPNARGFEEFYGFTSGHLPEYFDPVFDHNGAIVRGSGYFADDATDHAIAFIEENADRPFFCYVPYNAPHSPMQVPDRFYDKFDGAELAMRHHDPEREDIEHTRAALAMTEDLDWNVGRLLDKLDELGLAGDTIVVYFSDNGPNGWRWNGGMKGRKGSTDEGGTRSPLFIRWPGYIRADRHVSQVASTIDLLPTLAELASVALFADAEVDGMSLNPLLRGSSRNWPDRTVLTYWMGRASARDERYRLDHRGQLFDMDKDPGQSHDITAEKPEIAARLKKTRDEWVHELHYEIDGKNRPYTVGFAPLTLLSARDGIGHGTIRRSSRYPNGSYFTDWTSTEDRLTWYIHVSQAGEFEATVYYTCPEADIGSTIELSFRGESITAKVTEAHDPPLIGADQDRVPRQVSYTKDFRPLKIGTINLEQARGQLTLRATAIPGKQVMDIESITLRRAE